MIRSVVPIVLAVLLAATPAAGAGGADWSRFIDSRSGAAVDIPPGFTVDTRQGQPGAGRLFRSRDGRSLIRVAGQALAGAAFGTAIEDALSADQADGWAVTFRSQTPGWAAWSATRGGTILQARVILVCADSQLASVRMTHPAMDAAAYEPVFDRVARSLSQDGGCY